MPRRINRQRLLLADLEEELGDSSSRRSRVLKGLVGLLRRRHSSRAFDPTAPFEILSLDPRVFALRRICVDGAQEALCLHNVSADRLVVSGQTLGPYETSWLLA
jgi:hypothetical protein